MSTKTTRAAVDAKPDKALLRILGRLFRASYKLDLLDDSFSTKVLTEDDLKFAIVTREVREDLSRGVVELEEWTEEHGIPSSARPGLLDLMLEEWDDEPEDEERATVVTLTAFPEDRKVAAIKTICGATGLSPKEAKDAIENLPATLRAMVSNQALAEKLEALGATVTLEARS